MHTSGGVGGTIFGLQKEQGATSVLLCTIAVAVIDFVRLMRAAADGRESLTCCTCKLL